MFSPPCSFTLSDSICFSALLSWLLSLGAGSWKQPVWLLIKTLAPTRYILELCLGALQKKISKPPQKYKTQQHSKLQIHSTNANKTKTTSSQVYRISDTYGQFSYYSLTLTLKSKNSIQIYVKINYFAIDPLVRNLQIELLPEQTLSSQVSRVMLSPVTKPPAQYCLLLCNYKLSTWKSVPRLTLKIVQTTKIKAKFSSK